MTFPERFSELPPYAFPRLRTLLDGISPGKEPIDMTIGNPMHQFPQWISNILNEHISEFRGYPPNDGTNEIRMAISKWLKFRYGVDYDFENQIFPLMEHGRAYSMLLWHYALKQKVAINQ
jgi:N-succinyldiaminopimelate aminotransferase